MFEICNADRHAGEIRQFCQSHDVDETTDLSYGMDMTLLMNHLF